MKNVLVTGFEPFGGETTNPSQEIARQLNGRVIGGRRVIGRILPCVFGAAIEELEGYLVEFSPELIIGVGQAGGRAEITPERIAINVDDARIADNAGLQPIDRAIVKRGPAAYWSTLPVKAIAAALRAKEIPAAVSQTAGTFVCNHAFYGLMHALRKKPRIRGGFIHVPFSPAQAKKGQPSLPLETMVEAIATAVAVSLRTRRDLRVGEGQVS
ncbi:MAG: pyroglutamyl-peptidase [Verrucomicrobia bacterium]|nr:pyroglutamyl-peptidase [Verrucomicrobiota bacterium]